MTEHCQWDFIMAKPRSCSRSMITIGNDRYERILAVIWDGHANVPRLQGQRQ